MSSKKILLFILALSLILSSIDINTVRATEDKQNEKIINRLAVGMVHYLVLGRDGSVWSFGVNEKAQLGRETANPFDELKRIPNLNDAVNISVGKFSSYVITKEES